MPVLPPNVLTVETLPPMRLLTTRIALTLLLGGLLVPPAFAQAAGGGVSSSSGSSSSAGGGAAARLGPDTPALAAPGDGLGLVITPSAPRAPHKVKLSAAPAGLAAAVRGAARRNAALTTLLAQRARYEADARVGEAFLPRAPVLSAGTRGDRAFRDKGVREFEAALDVPLWLPGEGTALTGVARAEIARLDARVAAQGLVIAGEVRDAYWKGAAAAGVIAVAERRILEAEEVGADMQRRVSAGEAQPADLFLARAEGIEARAQRAEAAIAAREAALAFEALTGARFSPGLAPEPVETGASLAGHPRLVALRRGVEVSEASVRLARLQVVDNPTVGAFLRNERDERREPSTTSAGLRVSVPLYSGPRTEAKVEVALAELAGARAELAAAERQVRAEVEVARVQLASARALAGLAEQRLGLLSQQVDLVRRTFRAGEVALPEYLRQRTALLSAELARSRARLAVPQAVSRLNQALGRAL